MTEVVSGSIKNDSTPEIFGTRYTNSQGVPFASQFVKIIPLSSVLLFADETRDLLNTWSTVPMEPATIRRYGTLD
jgi:hypothetical protein